MKVHEIIFKVFLFLLPVQLSLHFWPEWALPFGIRVDYLAPTIYLTDLFLFFLIFLDFKYNKNTLGAEKSKKNLLFVFLLLYLFASILLVSKYKEASVLKYLKFIELYLLFAYSKKYLIKALSERSTFYLLLISFSFVSFLGILQFHLHKTTDVLWILGERSFSSTSPGIALVNIWGKSYMRSYSIFPHPNIFAGYLAVYFVLIFISINLAKFQKKTWLILLPLGLVAFFLTFSKAAFAALLFCLILTLFLNRLWLKAEILSKISILFIFLLSIISFFLFGAEEGVIKKLILSKFPLRSVEERLLLLEKNYFELKENPFFGLGLNNSIIPVFENGETKIRLFQPVHNVFILTLVESGIVGLLFLFWIFWLTLKRIFKSSFFEKGIRQALLFVFFFILTTGFFDHYWFTIQQSQLLFVLFLGIIWSEKRKSLL